MTDNIAQESIGEAEGVKQTIIKGSGTEESITEATMKTTITFSTEASEENPNLNEVDDAVDSDALLERTTKTSGVGEEMTTETIMENLVSNRKIDHRKKD